jgi:hypothetical protein
VQQGQFKFISTKRAPKPKPKPASKPAFTQEQRYRVTNMLIANGWSESWVSDAVVEEILRHEGKIK